MQSIQELKNKARKLISNKYLFALALMGVMFLIIPGSSSKKEPAASEISPPEFSLEAQEQRIKDTVESIEGVGKAKVILSLKGGVSRDIAYEQGSALVVSAGGGHQQAVDTRFLYPEYQGAVVVCEGGGISGVRLDVTNAVSSLTGLGSDRITIIRLKQR